MKRMLAAIIILSSFFCHKALDLDALTFDVTANNGKMALGDTCRFSFTGNPDIITFWSGETGRRYQYKDRTAAEGTPILRFRSKRSHNQSNTLALLISTDFTGVVKGDTVTTKANMANAHWNDLTAQANLSSANGVLSSSGPIDLSGYSSQNKPVYIAFKYKGLAGYGYNRWEIDSFYVNNNLPDGTSYVIANFNSYNAPYTNYGVSTFSPGFVFYTITNTLYWFNSTVNSQAGIVFKTDNAGLTADCESWAFVGPVDLKKVTPDAGVYIKTASQNLSDLNYTYKYSKTGTYDATFIGGKINRDEKTYITKPVQLIVQ
jgi:hypothetical protein